jgi:hypothetical protein
LALFFPRAIQAGHLSAREPRVVGGQGRYSPVNILAGYRLVFKMSVAVGEAPDLSVAFGCRHLMFARQFDE